MFDTRGPCGYNAAMTEFLILVECECLLQYYPYSLTLREGETLEEGVERVLSENGADAEMGLRVFPLEAERYLNQEPPRKHETLNN